MGMFTLFQGDGSICTEILLSNVVFTLVRTKTGTWAGTMGCMVLCRTFHIAPEPEQGPRPIVPSGLVPVPVSVPLNTP